VWRSFAQVKALYRCGGDIADGFSFIAECGAAQIQVQPEAQNKQDRGKSIVAFGKHTGKTYDQLPMQYRAW